MITATIVVTPTVCYVDYRTRHTDALEYVGSGIQIYLRKPRKLRYTLKRAQVVDYLALLVTQEHNIPCVSLKRVNIKELPQRKTKISDKQKSMF